MMKRRPRLWMPGGDPNELFPALAGGVMPGSHGQSRGPNILVDGDPAAVAGWDTYAGGTYADSTLKGAPAVLATVKSGYTFTFIRQNVLTAGQSYRVTGRAEIQAGDGGSLRIREAGGAVLWTGGVAGSVVEFDVSFTASVTNNLIFDHTGAAPTDAVKWAAIYLSDET